MVTFTSTVAGDVASFDVEAYDDALESFLELAPGSVSSTVEGGSVVVSSEITVDGADSASAVADTIESTNTTQLSEALGVVVESITVPTFGIVGASPPPPSLRPTGEAGSGSGSSISLVMEDSAIETDDDDDSGVNLGLAIGLPLGILAMVALGVGIWVLYKRGGSKMTAAAAMLSQPSQPKKPEPEVAVEKTAAPTTKETYKRALDFSASSAAPAVPVEAAAAVQAQAAVPAQVAVPAQDPHPGPTAEVKQSVDAVPEKDGVHPAPVPEKLAEAQALPSQKDGEARPQADTPLSGDGQQRERRRRRRSGENGASPNGSSNRTASNESEGSRPPRQPRAPSDASSNCSGTDVEGGASPGHRPGRHRRVRKTEEHGLDHNRHHTDPQQVQVVVEN